MLNTDKTMIREKLRKPWFWVLLISVLLNLILIIRNDSILQTREEKKDCADYALDQFKKEDSRLSLAYNEPQFKSLYNNCLKIRYGIDN